MSGMPLTGLDIRKEVEEEIRELIDPNDPAKRKSPLWRKIAYHFLNRSGEKMNGIEHEITRLAGEEARRRNAAATAQAALQAAYAKAWGGRGGVP